MHAARSLKRVALGRDDRLGQRVALLRRLLADLDEDEQPRLWIEGLPTSDASCAGLLDELARG